MFNMLLYYLIFEQKRYKPVSSKEVIILKHLTKRLDWLTTLVPFLCILFVYPFYCLS